MNTAESIKTILATHLFVEIPVSEMQEDDSLRDAFGLDSLGFVELRAQSEAMFGVTISPEAFTPDNFATIGRVAELVDSLRARASSPVPDAR